MIKAITERLRQGHRTIEFPKAEPNLPSAFRGLPVVDRAKCPSDCHVCVDVCPTSALKIEAGKWSLDAGRCLVCTDCMEACPKQALSPSKDYRMAVRKREDLIVEARSGAGGEARGAAGSTAQLRLARALEGEMLRVFRRSLKLRQVSAGGCNGCELDVNVLNTVVFDLGRFGVQFVASPRHADGLLITGPVTENMQVALRKTYEAVPDPKIVIAVGACAISGGIFAGHAQANGGASSSVPIDLFIPGCPPHPVTVLDGLLRFLGKLPGA